MAQGSPRPLGGTGAVAGDAHHRRTGTRAHGVRLCVVLGSHGHLHRGRRPAVLRRGTRHDRRRTGSDREGLRPRRGHEVAGAGLAGRVVGSGSRRRAARCGLRGLVRGGQALYPPAVPAFPHLDPAAGSGSQAPLRCPPGHVGGAASLRGRVHHLHAHRLHHLVGHRTCGCAVAGREAVRRGVRAGCAAHLRQEGQERARGPRGDQARRRRVQVAGHRGPGRGREFGRGAALRTDLEADRGLPDEGRQGREPLGASGRNGTGIGARRRVHGHRPVDHLPRLPPRLRRGQRRPRGRARRPGAPAPADASGRRRRPRRDGGEGQRDEAAGPIHRSVARQAARGARHRPALDVRVDHLDDPGPRVRRQAGHGARPHVHGLRCDRAARAALHRPRRLRVHGTDGGRPRPHRVRGRRGDPVVEPLLLRQRPLGSQGPGDGQSRQDRRPRGEFASARRRRERRDGGGPGGSLWPVCDPRRSAGQRARRRGARRADLEAGDRVPRSAFRRPHPRHRSRERPGGDRPQRPLRPIRPAR